MHVRNNCGMASDSCCSLPTTWGQIQGTALELKVSLSFCSSEFSAPVYGWRSGPLLAADMGFPDTYMGFVAMHLVCQPSPDQFHLKKSN